LGVQPDLNLGQMFGKELPFNSTLLANANFDVVLKVSDNDSILVTYPGQNFMAIFRDVLGA